LLCFRTAWDDPEQFELMRACCSNLEGVPWRESRKFSATFYLELARSLATPLPFTVLKYRSLAMMARLRALLAARQYDLLLCDFLQPSINCITLSFRPKVLFQHNVEAVIRTRQVEHTKNPVARAYLAHDATKLARYESRAAHAFDRCITVSEADRRLMGGAYNAQKTAVVPIGVDSDYFMRTDDPRGEPEIVFVGSMDMLANQDAVSFFVRNVFPLVREASAATFVVVGRNPPPSIARLSDVPGVRVTGTVPDVRPHLARAHVVVVPLRFGGGTRIKIFEAMAMGKAIVSTPLGAEGLPVTDGREVRLAENPVAFAAAITTLLDDAAERRRLGAAARATAERYGWDAVAAEFSRICADVVSGTPRRG
jgi:polysaccharide biosynthesis protein PslH